MLNKKNFTEKIVEWYEENKRDLPWRRTSDPYKVWLSEIILQQTRVAQGLPYYVQFLETFPTLEALAGAKEDLVLRTWQGLGYYTRARNLQRCAKILVKDYSGKFPTHYNELLKLPGIGTYTAAAIASICFEEPVAVVDGNVFRVLARLFGKGDDISTTEGRKAFFLFAQTLIPDHHPGIFNQAMMEFGALHCLPKNPKCEVCVFKKTCVAYAHNQQDLLPVKSKRVKTRSRYFTYFVFEEKKKLAMNKRISNDIWKGLFDFYLIESKRQISPQAALLQDDRLRLVQKEISILNTSRVYRHILTHQKLHARFVSVALKSIRGINKVLRGQDIRFYSAKHIRVLPKPVLVSRFLKENYGL